MDLNKKDRKEGEIEANMISEWEIKMNMSPWWDYKHPGKRCSKSRFHVRVWLSVPVLGSVTINLFLPSIINNHTDIGRAARWRYRPQHPAVRKYRNASIGLPVYHRGPGYLPPLYTYNVHGSTLLTSIAKKSVEIYGGVSNRGIRIHKPNRRCEWYRKEVNRILTALKKDS